MAFLRKRPVYVGIATAALFGTTACGTSSGGAAEAGEFPGDETITVIVPYDPGGPNDVSARSVAPCVEEELGTTLVIENKPGGGGTIGLKEVADSEPDGHTLGITSVSTAVVAPLLAGDVGFTYEDFDPLGLLVITPSLLVVQDSSQYASAEDFFAAAEQKPGGIKVGIPATFYDAELRRMEELYGVKFTRVPFNGTSDAVAALLGGNVDAVFGAADNATMEQVKAGEFRPLATGAEEPVAALEDTPTLISLGYEKLNLSDSVIGVSAPAGTPADVQKTLESALESCAHSDEMTKTLGEEYLPDDFVNGQEVATLFADAHEAFAPIFE